MITPFPIYKPLSLHEFTLSCALEYKRKEIEHQKAFDPLYFIIKNIEQKSANVNSFFVFFGKNTDENGESI